jgi:hypothetical protein
MFVISIVRHGNFALKSIEHLKRLPVFGVLLGDDGYGAGEKIFSGYAHALQQRYDTVEHAGKIID